MQYEFALDGDERLTLDELTCELPFAYDGPPVSLAVTAASWMPGRSSWGIDNNRAGTNSNRIVVMRRR